LWICLVFLAEVFGFLLPENNDSAVLLLD
jgi:hypothetical protein